MAEPLHVDTCAAISAAAVSATAPSAAKSAAVRLQRIAATSARIVSAYLGRPTRSASILDCAATAAVTRAGGELGGELIEQRDPRT